MKIFVLQAIIGNEKEIVGAFTTTEKLTDFTKAHSAAEVTKITFAAYVDPVTVELDPS